MAVHRRCRRVLFFKIKVRPRSFTPYGAPAHCTILLYRPLYELQFPQNGYLTTPANSLGHSKFKIYIWTYFWTKSGPILGLEGQKMAKRIISKLLILYAFGAMCMRCAFDVLAESEFTLWWRWWLFDDYNDSDDILMTL